MAVKDSKKTKAIADFVKDWTGRGDEKQDMQNFWRGLVRILADIDDPEKYLQFEKPVMVEGQQKYIDCYIAKTSVLIEQKSLGIRLDEKQVQSGGGKLTPFDQAVRYRGGLQNEEPAKYIVTSNFEEFWIYDLNYFNPRKNVIKLKLADLEKDYDGLRFITDIGSVPHATQEEVSLKAGDYVDKIYKAFAAQYTDSQSETSQKSLNILCVRLIFCLYAEDADILDKNRFYDFILSCPPNFLRLIITELFKFLDTPDDQRNPYLLKELPDFPYVNGGLFANENVEIPTFTEEIKKTLLDASGYDWAAINPTIFGAVFESTLNPVTRRAGGMHYTSIENIHKVIDPLFLNDLESEYQSIIDSQKLSKKKKAAALRALQDKLASLTFLENNRPVLIQSAAA